MTPQSDYIEKQKLACREWFKEHKAETMTNPDRTEAALVINWANPKSWNYGCRFIIHRRWLCVVGDIGEAVFEWGQDLTLEFLSGLDFGYFLSKCRASPSGSKFEQWDPRTASAEKEAHLSEIKAEAKAGVREASIITRIISDLSKGACREDYEMAARDIYSQTSDAEYASMIHGWGVVPSVHAVGMFVGLQMAIAQLKEAK